MAQHATDAHGLHRRFSAVAARVLIVLAAVALLACGDSATEVRFSEPSFGPGTFRVEVERSEALPWSRVRIELDGVPIAWMPEASATRYTLESPVASGPRTLVAWVLPEEPATGEPNGEETGENAGEEGVERAVARVDFVAPIGAPSLVESRPAAGALSVATGVRIMLRFETLPDVSTQRTLTLRCNGVIQPSHVRPLPDARIVVDPIAPLPSAAACSVLWRGQFGGDTIAFRTAEVEDPSALEIPHRRADGDTLTPFPDDWFTRLAPQRATGRVLDFQSIVRPDVIRLIDTLESELVKLDGFSPIGHMTVALPMRVDPSTLPGSPADSLDPLASVSLIDLGVRGGEPGARVPIRIELRDEVTHQGLAGQSMLVFPSVSLRPGGRYVLVVTRDVESESGHSLRPSAETRASLARRRIDEPPAVTRRRRMLWPVLAVLRKLDPLPIGPQDLALVLPFTVRSVDDLPRDPLAIRRDLWSHPRPQIVIDRVEPGTGPDRPLAAVVYGRFAAPDWRSGDVLARDDEGNPVRTGERLLPFTLALPIRALSSSVPLVFYQHGNPGRAEDEVPSKARDPLLSAGFAVVGFTDVLNRELATPNLKGRTAVIVQMLALLGKLVRQKHVPDFQIETTAEQLAFLRALPRLSALDLLPVGAPDGIAEISGSAPIFYEGVSQGANHGPALLAYAPEIRAATLVAGGARMSELLIHQQSEGMLDLLPLAFRSFRPDEVWAAMALFQTAFDRQDPYNHARFVHRERPAALASAPATSLLVVAAAGDRVVPASMSRGLAWLLGPLPWVGGAPGASVFLESVPGPVRGNLASDATGGYVELTPEGGDGPPTPGCRIGALPPDLVGEGHFCAQLAEESVRARVNFFLDALGPEPPRIEALPRVAGD